MQSSLYEKLMNSRLFGAKKQTGKKTEERRNIFRTKKIICQVLNDNIYNE